MGDGDSGGARIQEIVQPPSITSNGPVPIGPKMNQGKVVSLNFTSWNQLDGWLRQIETLRSVA